MDLGLTERQFWNSTPREIAALYRAKANVEARWRFYMATSMGAKHKSGRQLTIDDFLPQNKLKGGGTWQDWLRATKAFMGAFEQQGKVIN